uniref:PUL domain-containing protein n=1 Tax=Tetraselmis chuii TaxID=63592 RepID=A0A7S1T7H1_9CHLO|mmetsp:Transcript_7904/g.14187  ORF Transcript_7904/g.14187 Transcript_7904/m.14187 type:complete len:102 (+) Transcript_7904:289-594(+)
MVLNISMLLRSDSGCAVGDRTALKTQAVNCMVQLLIDGKGDELLFRALVAVGTLLHGDKQMQSMAKELMIMDVVRSASGRGTEAKVSQAMQDVVSIVELGL